MSNINKVTLLSDQAVAKVLSLLPIKPSMVKNARKVTDLVNADVPFAKACVNSGISVVTYRRVMFAGKVTPPVEWPVNPLRFGESRVADFLSISRKVMSKRDDFSKSGIDSYLLWVMQNDPAHIAAHSKALAAARAAAGSNTNGVTHSSGMCGGRRVIDGALFSGRASCDAESEDSFRFPTILGVKEWADKFRSSHEEKAAPAAPKQFTCTVRVDGSEVGIVTADTVEELIKAAAGMADAECAKAAESKSIERLFKMERDERLMREILIISRRIEDFRQRVSVARQDGHEDPVLAAFQSMSLCDTPSVGGVIGRP